MILLYILAALVVFYLVVMLLGLIYVAGVFVYGFYCKLRDREG